MRPMLMTVVCLLALGCAKAGGGAHGSLDAASGVDTTGGSMDGGISATEGGVAREASVGVDHPADVPPPRTEGGSMLGIDAPPAAGCVVRIPADANLINVKTAYGAMGDGKTDDTAAIQKAISDQLNGSRMVYLPKGVYLVRDRLQWRMGTTGFSAGWGAYLALIGDGPGETVIRLADRAMGFGDAKNPRAVVYTASRDDQNAYDDNTGPGNQAFANFIKDLTVDVGVGNPGAVGIDFQVSNWGALRNVTVRSTDAGETGISLSRRDNGPGLLKHVRVEGFRQGLTITDATYSFVIEDLELQGQTALGVLVKDAVVSVASLRAQTAGPALRLEGLSLVNLIGANLAPLAAGAASGAAVEINDKNAHLYARTMMTSGYGAAIMNRGVSVAGPMTEEFVSDAVRGLATPPGAALKLPIKPTPEICDGAVETWRSVGAPSGKDDTLAIQAALNSGAATVYFPNGSYVVADTLHVPATVKHVVGFESHIRAAAVHHFGRRQGAHPGPSRRGHGHRRRRHRRLPHGSEWPRRHRHRGRDDENVGGQGQRAQWRHHLVPEYPRLWRSLRRGRGGQPASGQPAAGLGSPAERRAGRCGGEQRWRQPVGAGVQERTGRYRPRYAQRGPHRDPGRKSRCIRTVPTGHPAVSVEDSSVTISLAGTAYVPGFFFKTLVRETKGGKTQEFTTDQAYYRGLGTNLPLYVGNLP